MNKLLGLFKHLKLRERLEAFKRSTLFRHFLHHIVVLFTVVITLILICLSFIMAAFPLGMALDTNNFLYLLLYIVSIFIWALTITSFELLFKLWS